MDITLVQGATKHQIHIEGGMTVQELMELVENVTAIPTFKQKLIYKGISISKDPDKLVDAFQIRDKSKLMVIGQRHDPEEEEALKILEKMNKTALTQQGVLKDLQDHLDSVKKGFVEGKNKETTIELLQKQILKCTENTMKHVESLDELNIGENFKDARNKRKQIIKRFQLILDGCDKLAEDVSQVT